MPRRGVVQGPPVFTPTKERQRHRCAGVLWGAVHLRHTVGPKSIAAPKCPEAGTAAIGSSYSTGMASYGMTRRGAATATDLTE